MMKKIFIISILLLSFVGCTKDVEIIKEATKTVSYKEFDFDIFYNLVKNPISIDLLKRRLEAQKIEYKSLGGYDKDIFFIIPSTQTAYKYYKIEVQVGDVLVNFNSPTSKDVGRDYIQNITIYPLDDNQKIITEEQSQEQYKSVFDLVKNSMQKINPNYQTEFKIVSLFGGGVEDYDTFVNDMEFDDGIALWSKDFDEEITLENSSNEKNVPKIEMTYKPSDWGLTKPLPYGSRYQIKIIANLPKDIKKILF